MNGFYTIFGISITLIIIGLFALYPISAQVSNNITIWIGIWIGLLIALFFNYKTNQIIENNIIKENDEITKKQMNF